MYYENLRKEKKNLSPYMNEIYGDSTANETPEADSGFAMPEMGAWDDDDPKKDGDKVGVNDSAEDKWHYYNAMRNIDRMKSDVANMNRKISALNPTGTQEYREKVKRIEEASSPEKVQSRVNDYYNSNIANIFRSEKTAAEKRGQEQYRKYASYVGFDPHTALGAAEAEVDPMKVINSTLSKVNRSALVNHFAPYADALGMSGEKYVNDIVIPMISNRLYDEYVNENIPKNSVEYVLRNAYSNSLMGLMSNMSRNAYSGTNSYSAIQSEAMQRYNGSRMENFLSGVGSLLIDAPAFAFIGNGASAMSGRVTPMLTKGLMSNFMLKSAGKGLSKEAAKQYTKNYMKENIVSQIVNSGLTQGVTLGTYNLAQSVASDIVYNEKVNWDNAGDAFGHGMGTGVMLGVVGTPLRRMASKAKGAGKLAADTGVLSAEALVFTMGTEYEKIKNDVEIAPIDLFYDFVESAATLGVMRAAHWRPKGGERKIDTSGRLRKELRFSMGEMQEIKAAGVEPNDLSRRIENVLNLSNDGRISADAESLVNDYVKLMASENLSASARSKLMYIVEDKLTSAAPSPVNCKVEDGADGSVSISTYDVEGRLVKNFMFKDKFSAENYLISNKSVFRRNKLQAYTDALTQNANSRNFLRQANEYAKETGVSPDEIAEAMYKRANKENITEREAEILNDILQRSAYTPDEVTILLKNAQNQIEDKYRLADGDVTRCLESDFYRLSKKENQAVEEYVALVEELVKGAENGLPMERKIEEVERKMPKNNADVIPENFRGGIEAEYFAPRFGWGRAGKEEYVWSPIGRFHTRKEVENLEKDGMKFSKNLGTKVEFITDENQIGDEATQFSSKLQSLGWYDEKRDVVVINLPNITNEAELRRIIIHEVVGHKGLHDVFGYHMSDFLEEVYEKADPEIKKEINQISKVGEYRNPYYAVDEYIARLSEKVNLAPKERTIMQRFKDFVREMLVRFNLYGGKKNFSEQDLLDVMQQHYNSILEGRSVGSHRRRAFGDFEQGRHRESSYYDLDTNVKLFKKNNPDMNFENVNEFFRDTKKRLLDGVKFRFIGERGLENLNYSGNNDYDNLKVAKMLDESGASNAFIKRKTGWERGRDNMWRYEISESKMRIKNPVMAINEEYSPSSRLPYGPTGFLREDLAKYNEYYNVPEGKNLLRLRHIVDDKVFFGAYPEFADMEVRIYDGERGACYYNPREEVLYIDDSQLKTGDFKRELAGSMQRMIQDYEDFARAFDVHDPDVDDIESYQKAIENIENIKMYQSVKGMEREAKLFENLFIEAYGVPYNLFLKIFPTENDYNIYRDTGNANTLSGLSEVKNVKHRFNYRDDERWNSPSSSTEMHRSLELIPAKKFEDLERLSDGPIDRLMRIVKQNDSDRTLYPEKRIFLKYTDPKPSMMQRYLYQKYMNEWKNEENLEFTRPFLDFIRDNDEYDTGEDFNNLNN